VKPDQPCSKLCIVDGKLQSRYAGPGG